MEAVANLIERIVALHDSQGLVLVGIDGLGGAGKSSFARTLASHLVDRGCEVRVIRVDDFFFPTNERSGEVGAAKPIGGDVDWHRLQNDVLVPLRAGHIARYVRYDWPTDTCGEAMEALPAGIVLVEGVTACRLELSEAYDLKIWVSCSRVERLSRGLARDGETARKRWEKDWMPAEDAYSAAHDPEGRADFIVDGEAS